MACYSTTCFGERNFYRRSRAKLTPGLLDFCRYLPLVPILIVLAFIPGYTLRLHHYLYSLIAIPVLSLPNRVSLFGQAFTYALFIDGVGRWGWASIVQQTTTVSPLDQSRKHAS